MHKSTLITYFITSLLKKHSINKKEIIKISVCVAPLFPSQFQIFQQNFVTILPK